MNMKIKLTHDEAQEVLHKMTILCDDPDLQESYGITQEQADRIWNSIPHIKGGEWDVPTWAENVVTGEMQDHVKILRACAAAARDDREIGQSLRIYKQAKKFETVFSTPTNEI